MSIRNRPLVLSALFAVLTACLFQAYLRSLAAQARAEERPSPERLATVVVARERLRPSTVIREGMVELRRVPEAQAPRDAAADLSAVLGRAAAREVLPGEVLTAAMLSDRRQLDVPGVLEGAKVAVSVSIDDPMLQSGLLKPGDFVNVLASFPSGRVVTALWNAEVLAVHGSLDRGQRAEAATSPGAEATPSSASLTLAVPLGGAELLSALRRAASLDVAVLPADGGARGPTRVNPAAAQALRREIAARSGSAGDRPESRPAAPARPPLAPARRVPAPDRLLLPAPVEAPAARPLPKPAAPAPEPRPRTLEILQGTHRTVVPLD